MKLPRQQNRLLFKVMSDHTLHAIADICPTTEDELKGCQDDLSPG
jgi:DNA-directed RNA polymerase subunit F